MESRRNSTDRVFHYVAERYPRFRSVTTAPLARTRSFGAIGNTSFHVPAAAHTSSYCNKSRSMKMRNVML